jgi:hypothetical protein
MSDKFLGNYTFPTLCFISFSYTQHIKAVHSYIQEHTQGTVYMVCNIQESKIIHEVGMHRMEGSCHNVRLMYKLNKLQFNISYSEGPQEVKF